MKSSKLDLSVVFKFDERLRVVENLISVREEENKMQSISSNEKCKACYNKIGIAQL